MNRKWYGLVVLLIIATAGDSMELAPSTRKTKEKVTAEDFPPEIVDFVPYRDNPLFTGTGKNTWDCKIRERGYILREGNTYHMWYTGYNDDRSGPAIPPTPSSTGLGSRTCSLSSTAAFIICSQKGVTTSLI
jgi:hypothetical protein